LETKPPLKKLKLALILVALLVGALFAVRYYNMYRLHVEKQTRFMMSTYVTVHAVGPKRETAPAVNLALDRMQEVETKFNHLNPKSPVYAFNHDGTPITDLEVLEVVKLALQISRESDGAFDITIEPCIEIWGFYAESPHLPTKEEIKTCVEKVGYRHLGWSESRLEKTRPDVRIDLGGIAKGYALREALKVLRKEGVKSALIDVGGDVYALGKRGGDFWKVGIRNPRGEDVLGYVEVEDLAVVGSGDYERYFIHNGKRYHHIFEPKTGYPAEGMRATWILHPDPLVAQGHCSTIFILGPERGMQLVEKIPGMEAIMVTASGEMLYSPGLKHAVQPISKPQ